MSRQSRSFTCWLVLFGLVLNGLMPLVSYAALKANPQATMEICSVSGQIKPDVLGDHKLTHAQCSLCCLGFDTPLERSPATLLVLPVQIGVAPDVAKTFPPYSIPQAQSPPSRAPPTV